jgi:hypothetical protein
VWLGALVSGDGWRGVDLDGVDPASTATGAGQENRPIRASRWSTGAPPITRRLFATGDPAGHATPGSEILSRGLAVAHDRGTQHGAMS